MNEEQLFQAADNQSTIKYVPKGTEYRVLGRTKIKRDDGSWVDGIAYAGADKVIYDRPLTMFKDFELVD